MQEKKLTFDFSFLSMFETPPLEINVFLKASTGFEKYVNVSFSLATLGRKLCFILEEGAANSSLVLVPSPLHKTLGHLSPLRNQFVVLGGCVHPPELSPPQTEV
jgi:hypothetical protein